MPWPLRLVMVVLVLMLLALQYRLWVGRGSIAGVADLERRIEAQQARITQMRARNARLRAEVASLKQGLDAVEARARLDLGLIKEGELFYQVIPKEQP